jgi:ATP-dependent protease Clp ATPase subunit
METSRIGHSPPDITDRSDRGEGAAAALVAMMEGSVGGTAPQTVRKMAKRWIKRLETDAKAR